jgi:Phosphopantetheine attachment site/AMP-binding enzyme C-terminal domain
MLRNCRMDGERMMDCAAIKQVQAVLAAFPGLDAVTVTERDAEPVGHCLIAYVAPSGVDLPALHEYARKHLPGRLVPAAFVVLDAIPITASGTDGPQPFPPPDLDGLMPYRAPGTARQESLCKIFAEVLRVPRLGLDDDFFSLGGRSVHAVLLAGRINSVLGVKMPMADLFDAPTVAELDRRLDVLSNASQP